MKALVASSTFPADPERMVHGPYQRLNLFIGALKEDFRLHLLFFVPEEIDVSPPSLERHRRMLVEHWGVDLDLSLVHRQEPPDRLTRWQAYGPPVLKGFRQWKFRWASGARQRAALEEALDRGPDLLFVHRLPAMAPVLATRQSLPPVCFDLDDIEHLAAARSIPEPPVWPAKRLEYLQLPALWWAERRAIALADRTFVCSPRDRSYLERTMRVGGLRVVPNAVAVPEPAPAPAPGPTALFIGSLSYAPNRNAASYLVGRIWPHVRQRVPGARLVVAGRYPEQVPESSAPPPGVEFSGFVDDLAALYAGTRVVCAPIRAGGGTRIKVIEAAAFGRAVVSTSQGAEGLDLADGREILIRDDPDAFAAAVADLMLDEDRAASIGMAGREKIRRTYERGQVIRQIEHELHSCAGASVEA